MLSLQVHNDPSTGTYCRDVDSLYSNCMGGQDK
jgi:hypothetical protein